MDDIIEESEKRVSALISSLDIETLSEFHRYVSCSSQFIPRLSTPHANWCERSLSVVYRTRSLRVTQSSGTSITRHSGCRSTRSIRGTRPAVLSLSRRERHVPDQHWGSQRFADRLTRTVHRYLHPTLLVAAPPHHESLHPPAHSLAPQRRRN